MKLKRMIPYCEAQVKFDCTPEEAAERIFMCPGVEELKLYGRWEPESSTLLLTSASGGALRALLRPHVTGEYTGSGFKLTFRLDRTVEILTSVITIASFLVFVYLIGPDIYKRLTLKWQTFVPLAMSIAALAAPSAYLKGASRQMLFLISESVTQRPGAPRLRLRYR